MNSELLPRDGLILCAVSGGVDSMYMLCRLKELGFDVAAAHFNHGLRGAEADRDEAFVRDFCGSYGIPFLSDRADVSAYARDTGIGIEAAARTLRYAFLERAADALGAAVIATAHTADDNAETVLMHLVRGSGSKGLCGIPPRRGRIVRPMLDTTHGEAADYLAEQGIPHVEDATNAADAYARNRLRHHVVPALTAENPAFLEAVGRMTELLRQDEEYLSGAARDFIKDYGDGSSLPAEALAALPVPVASRVVRLMAGTELSRQHTSAILNAARNGSSAGVSGLRAAVSGGRLYFAPEQGRSLPDRTLRPGRSVALPEADLWVRCDKIGAYPADVYKSLNTFYFNCANICGNMTVGSRRAGDRCRPVGRGCTKTLKALFQELGVPPWRRCSIPVLRDEAGVIGLYGAGPAERVCARPGDRDVLRIDFFRLSPEDGGI